MSAVAPGYPRFRMPVLAPLVDLVADEPTLTDVVGLRQALLSIPEPARALAIAGLAQVTGRRPLLVVTPTGGEAERLADDLRAYLGEDEVDVFPAWETLPFERVSPSVETMARRLRTMWQLSGWREDEPDRSPAVVIAPVRAALQRLGPHVEDSPPIVVRPGDRIDPVELVTELVAIGYRREYQVEHRGEVAVRGSIVDVYPATADAPVRIDLWGDEVDRLTRFSVHDQRSTDDLPEAVIFGCRELRPTDDVRQRADDLIDAEPWGAEQWERLREGSTWDGMESWLPWLATDEHVIVDLLPPDALVLLLDPRRLRDRAAELLDEEAALASTLARTWGAQGTFPRLHVDVDRLLAHTTAPIWTVTTVPEGPGTAVLPAMGWNTTVGDPSAVVARSAGC